MSALSPSKAASNERVVKTGLRAFFSNVWASFQRQSELQVMLSAGYPVALAPAKTKRLV